MWAPCGFHSRDKQKGLSKLWSCGLSYCEIERSGHLLAKAGVSIMYTQHISFLPMKYVASYFMNRSEFYAPVPMKIVSWMPFFYECLMKTTFNSQLHIYETKKILCEDYEQSTDESSMTNKTFHGQTVQQCVGKAVTSKMLHKSLISVVLYLQTK